MGNRWTPAAARGSCWRRVALLNSCFDQCTALSGRKVLALANGENFFGEVRIFHNGAEPARVIFLMQVMQPGRIVNALGELYEDHEILCPQIELPCRAAEVKAPVRTQLTFHIFAHMPLAFDTGWHSAKLHRRSCLMPCPQHSLALFKRLCDKRRRRQAEPVAEMAQCLMRCFPNGNNDIG